MHHRKELEAYKDNHPSNHSAEYREECNQHIDIMLEFLRERFNGELELEEARHNQTPPKCTFEYLWMIFKPGVDVYAQANYAPLTSPCSVFVVSTAVGDHSEQAITPYTINMWDLQSNGDSLIRCYANTSFLSFDGEMEITSLAAFPLSFMQEGEKKALEDRLIARGKRCYEYTSISHKHFHGYTFSTPRRLVCTQA